MIEKNTPYNWKDYFLYKEDAGNYSTIKVDDQKKFFIGFLVVVIAIIVFGKLSDEKDEEEVNNQTQAVNNVSPAKTNNNNNDNNTSNISKAMPRAYQHHSAAPNSMSNNFGAPQPIFNPNSMQGQGMYQPAGLLPGNYNNPLSPRVISPQPAPAPQPAPTPVFNITVNSNNENKNG